MHIEAKVMDKKLTICLIEPNFHRAFKVPSSNFEKILFSISDEFYIIKAISDNLIEFNDKTYNEYSIIHKTSSKPFERIIRYLYLQIKISIKLISIRNKINFCIFFNENGLLIPLIVAKLLGKIVLFQLPSSLIKRDQYTEESLSSFLLVMQHLSYILSDNIGLYSHNLIKEWELGKYRKKIYILHRHFIDFNKFCITKKYNNREDIIGYVGRLEKEKGICNFIKAIKYLIRYKKHLKVLIIGDGSLKNEIISYIYTNNLQNQVEVVSWIKHDELPFYLNQLKLLIIPSYTEGLPNIMLEAMACGTPILTTSVGGIPDYIIDKKTGFILLDNNPITIYVAIINSLKYSHLDNIVENASKLVKTEFKFEKVVENWKNLFKDLNL